MPVISILRNVPCLRAKSHVISISSKAEMNSAGRLPRNSRVDQHCHADSQGNAENGIDGDASSLASLRTSGRKDRSRSGSLFENVSCMLASQDARIWTENPIRSSKQNSCQTIKTDAGELFGAKHSNGTNQYESTNPLDHSWLLERCDGDSSLVNEVLQTFCAQGLIHIHAMHQSKVDGDIVATLFHVVRPDTPPM
jgi:hypothetical protein